MTEDDDASSRAGDMSDEEEHDADDDNDDALVPWSKESETLSDRFYALKDIIPPTTRQSIGLAISTTASWIKWSGLKVGNAAWIVTTTSLLVGLPLVLSIQTEGDIMAQEAQVYPPAQGVQPVRNSFLSLFLP